MKKEAWIEGRSPIIQVNDVVDALAKKHLLKSQFTDLFGTKQFPGEGHIRHYQMDFALDPSLHCSAEELALYGQDAKPGMQIIKIRKKDWDDLQPGFDVILRRIIVKDDRADLFVNFLSHAEVTVDLTTGTMSFQRGFTRTREPEQVIAELKSMVTGLQMPTTRLINAGFSDRKTGVYHSLTTQVES